jgi:5-methylcytosine-specific restriction endonuclease McrA
MIPSHEDYAAAWKILTRGKPMPCAYCGNDMIYGDQKRHPTRDHIWPKAVRSISEGRIGRVWCCASCNLAKGDMMPSEWLKVLTGRNEIEESE